MAGAAQSAATAAFMRGASVQVRFVKDFGLFKAGAVKTVHANYGRYIIRRGVAEVVATEAETAGEPKAQIIDKTIKALENPPADKAMDKPRGKK